MSTRSRIADAPGEDPACSNCPYFRPPSAAAGAVGWSGGCMRFPQAVPKRGTDICGEHPRFKSFRLPVATKEVAHG